MLCDILVLSSEVLTYSSSVTCYTSIFALYWLEVFALAFLREGDIATAIIFEVYNTTIKLKIVGKSEAFTLLS
jgi:hypothetical protein